MDGGNEKTIIFFCYTYTKFTLLYFSMFLLFVNANIQTNFVLVKVILSCYCSLYSTCRKKKFLKPPWFPCNNKPNPMHDVLS